MTRRLLAMLIALIGTAGLVALGLSTFFPVEDRVTLAQPGPVTSVEVDVEVGRVTVVPGEGDLRLTVDAPGGAFDVMVASACSRGSASFVA